MREQAIDELRAELFTFSQKDVVQHYETQWTDDSPQIFVTTVFKNGDKIRVYSKSQHAFMLPLSMRINKNAILKSFNPRLASAIRALLPEGFVNRERLTETPIEGTIMLFKVWEGGAESLGSEGSPNDSEELEDVEALINSDEGDEFFEELVEIIEDAETEEEAREARARADQSKRLLRGAPFDKLEDILEAGADPNVADDVGQTALMHAAFPPLDRERFRLLVQYGADPHLTRQDGLSGLQLACSGGDFEPVGEWLDAGAAVNQTTAEGRSPLMFAARRPKLIRLLLKHGADVSLQDEDGHTALFYAIERVDMNSKFECVQLLLSAGADPKHKDKEGRNALDFAREQLAQLDLAREVDRAFGQKESPNEAEFLKKFGLRVPRETAAKIVTLLEEVIEGTQSV